MPSAIETPPIVQPPTATIVADSPSPFTRPELFNDLANAFAEADLAPATDKSIIEDPAAHAHDDPDRPGERELKPEVEKPKATVKPKSVAKPAVADKSSPPTPPPTANAKSWKEMNEERTRLRDQVVPKLETELAELKPKLAELERLRSEHAQLSTIVKQGMMERDPEVVGPIKAAIDEAISLARSAVPSDQSDRVAQLLQQPESDWRTQQLEDIVAGLSPLRQGRLLDAVNSVDRATRQRAALSSRSEEWLKARSSEVIARRDQERSRLLETFNHVSKSLANENPLFKEIEGNDAFNASVSERREMAKNIFSGRLQKPEDLAQAAHYAAAYPALLEALKLEKQRSAQYQAELESLRGAEPGLDGGGGEGEGGSGGEEQSDTKREGESYGQYIARLASREGAFTGR